MIKKLKKILNKNNLKLNYIDIGARGDLSLLWKKLDSVTQIFGFETDPKELTRLKNKFPSRKYFEFGLWNNEDNMKLHITKNPSSSSLYEPNFKENKKYKDKFHNVREVIETETIYVNRLDSIKIDNPDFIKIDTQGAEFKIIEGAKNILTKNCPIVSVESWTRDVYRNAPTMEMIISLMKSYGYEILDMELCASEKHKNQYDLISKHSVSGYEITFGKKNLDNINKHSKFKYILLLDLFGYRDLSIFLNNEYLNNNELESYLVNNGLLKNNLKLVLKKIFKIISLRLIGSEFYKISD